MNQGESKVGFFFDGVDDGLPPVTGLLTLSSNGEILIELPTIHPGYFEGRDTGASELAETTRVIFEKYYNWSRRDSKTLPRTLLFQSSDLVATLAGVRWAGYSGGQVKAAKFSVDTAIFEEAEDLQDEYLIKELRSEFDGLRDFCGFHGFRVDNESFGVRSSANPIEVLPPERTSWSSGSITYEFRSEVLSESQPGSHFSLGVQAKICTIADDRATVNEHLVAQEKIHSLLALLFGCRLPWRSHEVVDEAFPTRYLSDAKGPTMPVSAVNRRTHAQFSEEPNSRFQLAFPLADLESIGADGFAKWCNKLEDNDFRRAVDPAVAAITAKNSFLEPRVMMLAMALDRFGYCLADKPKNQRLAKAIEKCLDNVSASWLGLGTNIGISRFLAGVNNALKHPDYATDPRRNGYPTALELIGANTLASVVARGQALKAVDASDEVIDNFHSSNAVQRALEIFNVNGLRITDDGRTERS